MSRAKVRSRTVELTSTRDDQLVVLAAYLDLKVEEVIEASILATITQLAARDSVLAQHLAHASGMQWDELEDEETDVIEYIRVHDDDET